MPYVIKDMNTGEYYRNSVGSTGWYSDDINFSRIYSSEKQTNGTIDKSGHHVIYPGNRNLKVIEIKIVEL